MLFSYLKIRFNIVIRSIKSLGAFGVIIMLPILLLLIYNFHTSLAEFAYKRVVLSILYFTSVFSYTLFRKDANLLKLLGSKYKLLYFVENLIISIPLTLEDYILFPFYLLINITVVSFSGLNGFFKIGKKVIIKSPYKTGSIEWESLFRRYSIFALPIWVILFIISVYYNNQNLGLFALTGFSIETTAVNYFIEPLSYLKQYQTKKSVYEHKIQRMFLHAILPTLLLFSVYAFIFPNKKIALVVCISATMHIIGTSFVKLAIPDNTIGLRIIQGLFLAVCIAFFLNPGFLLILVFFAVYIVYKGYKNLKEIYSQ